MMGSLNKTVAELSKKFSELYEQLVSNNARFDELRKYTKETLDEFKRLLERLSDKFDNAERDRIRRETELTSKINSLEAKLEAMSEKAMHAVAKEAAFEIFERWKVEQQRDRYESDMINQNQDKKQLPNQASDANSQK